MAFYVLLSSVPCLAAVVWTYGLFADPNSVEDLAGLMSGLVPPDIAQMLGQQITRLAHRESANTRTLLATAGWLAFTLWSANQGMRGLVDALNQIYDRTEERGLWLRLLLTILMTIGLVVLLVLMSFTVLMLPAVVSLFPSDYPVRPVLTVLRWPGMFVLAAVAIALILRVGPSRRRTAWPSILLGSSIASLLWLGISFAFSWYALEYASFSALYGSLASVVAYMTWLWLSALTVLVGAEIDTTLSHLRLEENFSRQKSKHQEYSEDHDGYDEQPFCDRGRPGGDISEAKDAGDDRHEEKDQR